MDDGEKGIVVTVGAIVAGYFLVVKPLLVYFGASPAEKAALNSIDTADPTVNPFSFQFQPFQSFFNNFGANATDANGNQTVLSLTDYNVALKQTYDALDPVPALDFTNGNAINAAIAGENIYSSFGFFHLAANTDLVLSTFAAFTTQAQVAAVDAYLQANYGYDLWTILKNGIGGSFRGLYAADLANIVQIVQKLPQS